MGIVLMAVLMLTGCKTSQTVQKGGKEAVSGKIFKQKVMSNNQTAKAITAKMKIRLIVGDKDFSLGGSLKMMRDDVIQLSLSFLGMEVGRMEFTQSDVLVVDRVHRQYARVPYSKIDFLQSANLDFSDLQALFWNEIFVPGQRDVAAALDQFSLAESGDHTLLSLKSAPKLDYSFLTVTSSALLSRTSINPKNAVEQDNLVCKYDNFTKLGGHNFPSQINVTFKGAKTYTMDISLSGLNNATDWTTRTQVSSKYTPMNIEKLLEKMAAQ